MTVCSYLFLFAGDPRQQSRDFKFMHWRHHHDHWRGEHGEHDSPGGTEQNQGLHRGDKPNSGQVRWLACLKVWEKDASMPSCNLNVMATLSVWLIDLGLSLTKSPLGELILNNSTLEDGARSLFSSKNPGCRKNLRYLLAVLQYQLEVKRFYITILEILHPKWRLAGRSHDSVPPRACANSS